MKAKPILFSGAMVRAILAGTKTQTRRCVKPQPTLPIDWCHYSGWAEQRPDGTCTCRPVKPKYLVGDTLWVREAFSAWFDCFHWYVCEPDDRRGVRPSNVFYRATHPYPDDDQKWVPGIFLPRAFSRITLEVTEVRCERLHSMSDADREAEGLPSLEAFLDLWQKLNGKKHPWETNPWCWAYTFRRVTDV